jgi:hypothetical protein
MLQQLDSSHAMCRHLIWGSSHATALPSGCIAGNPNAAPITPSHTQQSPQLWTGMQHSNISVHKLLAQQRLQLLV